MKRPRLLKMLEGEFQDQVTELATLCGWWWWHDNDPRRNKAGLPDLLFGHERRRLFFWCELKIPPRTTTPAQDACIAMLRACGQTVYVWRPGDRPEIDRVLIGRAT